MGVLQLGRGYFACGAGLRFTLNRKGPRLRPGIGEQGGSVKKSKPVYWWAIKLSQRGRDSYISPYSACQTRAEAKKGCVCPGENPVRVRIEEVEDEL